MSPGHLYHYFPSKDAIIEQMANDYLASLHGHFSDHPEGAQTATVLLSELWSMRDWDDLSHCRILFELLAEAGRNERIRAILKENTDGVRTLLTEALTAGQSRGEVDPHLDPKHTSAVLVAILDAAPMLPLMTADLDFEESRKLVTTMVSRFLKPEKTQSTGPEQE